MRSPIYLIELQSQTMILLDGNGYPLSIRRGQLDTPPAPKSKHLVNI